MPRHIGWLALLAASLAACNGSNTPLTSSTTGSSSQGSTSQSTSSSTGQGTSSGGLVGSSSTGGSTTSGSTTTSTTGGGTASSTTGTTGASSGGTGTDGGCLNDGRGGTDYAPCLRDDDCACPLACNSGTCNLPCATTADCPVTLENCQAHFCSRAACSVFKAPCDSADAGDGTCQDLGSGSSPLLLCRQAGSAPLDSCDRGAARQTPDLLCPVGYACNGSINGDVCLQLCTVGDDGGCPAGNGCESLVDNQGKRGTDGFCAPVADAGCASEGTGVNFEFTCLTSADCECPFTCALENVGPTGRICRTPCTASTDCASAAEWCFGGLCRAVDCGVLADGGTNGAPGGSCLGSNGETGTCFGPFGSGRCYRAGTVAANADCDATSTSWDPAQQCASGSLCYSSSVGALSGVCVALCEVDAGSTDCATGYGCDQIYVDFFDSNLGECVPLGEGGCNASGRGDTLSICDTSAHCECPYVCSDAGASEPICVVPCQVTADCPDPATSCQGGICLSNQCSVLGSVCDAGGANDGLCQPEPYPASGLLCVQGGDGGPSCDSFGTRTAPSSLCPSTETCVQEVGGGTCELLCDPAHPTACATGDVCFPRLNGLTENVCLSCVDVQGFCTDTSQCCAGVCDATSFVCL